MGESMGNKSLLNVKTVPITDKLIIRIPTVSEVLDNQDMYFTMVSIITSTPFQYMVQLDDLGIDYTAITPYQMFLTFFPLYIHEDLSILFGDIDLSDFGVYENKQNDTTVLYNPTNDIIIDELVYENMATVLRQINLLKKVLSKPGNENAKEYLLEKERKRLKRLARERKKKSFEISEFEKHVIALVNNKDFKYNYEDVGNLSIYKFYQSFKQIQTNINFNNVMRGVYAGTVDTTKIDKSVLSWIPS